MSSPAEKKARRMVIGAMTGTSIDGIDVALVEITGRGLAMEARLLDHNAAELGELAAPLRAAAEQQPMPAGEFAELALAFGHLHADVMAPLAEHADRIDLIAAHGQTIYHKPPHSWQLINSAPLVQQFGCSVVTDLRAADLAAGGQGAPITPLADWVMFRSSAAARAIVNLGGFCNVTILPRDDGEHMIEAITGRDVCPCNHLLDALARRVLNQPFDIDGQAAQAGAIDKTAFEALETALRRTPKRSLGTGDEALAWIDRFADSLTPNDLAATAAGALGRCISASVAESGEIILAGGGARNRALTDAIATASNCPVRESGELGVPIEAREAMAMAILGALADDGDEITLASVTGRGDVRGPGGAWRLAGSNVREEAKG